MKVNYIPRISTLIQNATKKDTTFFAIKDANTGLTAVKSAIESMKVNNETPIGPTDGTNATFVVQNEPSFIVVNGLIKYEGVDYSYANKKIIFNSAPPLNAVVRSHYI